jgi:aspartate aminotransferase
MKSIQSSATVSINALAQEKKERGELVYNFAAGDPVLETHPAITQAALREAEKKFCPYPPPEGICELRSACASWMNTSYNTTYERENVLVTNGGKFGIFTSLLSLIAPHDEVIIAAPHWVSYPTLVSMVGGIPKIVPTKETNGWKLTCDELSQAISTKTKVLILNNACNPTGALYTKEELTVLLNCALHAGLKIISDEVYSSLVYDNATFHSCGGIAKDSVIVIQSMSKNFGMPGWRVGFVLGSKEFIQTLSIIHGQTTTGVPLVPQHAALGALQRHLEVSNYVKNAMQQRRDVFIDAFNSLFPIQIHPPQSSLYAFVKLSKETNSIKFCKKILSTCNVALVPGIAFGAEGFVRFAFSETEKTIQDGLKALSKELL